MKKGFTLIEMIGVMVILSLLILFATPNVINYIKSGGETKDKVVETMIFEATKQYIIDNQSMYKKDSKNTYCISLNTLASEGYVESPIKLSSSDEDITSETSNKVIKVTYDKKYKYELVNECIGIINPIPDLTQGLTPVMYDGDNWVVASPKYDDWYNYGEQRWANAVVLRNDVTKTRGQTVTVEGENPEALMMLVWIPRYEYKIEGQYGKHPDGTDGTQDTPGEIKVNFIGKNITTPTSGYHIHPAFTFDGEKNGFWVGKFEISHTTLSSSTTENNLGCSTTSCTNVEGLRILPNVQSLRYNNISNFWYAIKSIENKTNVFGLTNMDTHMMKNSEWGAVAYLSQSKYGKYGNSDYVGVKKEVYQNKSSSYITGSSNGTPSQNTANTQCTYDDTTNNCGVGASTTGNIYGVYDMSGGTMEYVMGVAEYNYMDTPGFIIPSEMIDPKYYDIYMEPPVECNGEMCCCESKACNNEVCFGHAMSETCGSSNDHGWYSDFISMVDEDFPWFIRGGNYNNGTDAGIFAHYAGIGGYDEWFNENGSTRFVGFKK